MWVPSFLLIVLGLTSTFVFYSNLYTLKQEIIDSVVLPIEPKGNNSVSVLISMRNVVKVRVIVGNAPWGTPSMWGDCYWIRSSFQISILDSSQEHISTISTPHSPPVDCVFEDIPTDVNYFGGVQITNPEDHPVGVIVTISFFQETLDSNVLVLMCVGIASIVAGLVAVLLYRTRKLF